MKGYPKMSTYSWGENGQTTKSEYIKITIIDGVIVECIHKVNKRVDKRQNGDKDFYNLLKICFKKLVVVDPDLFKKLYKELMMHTREFKLASKIRFDEISRLNKVLKTLS